MPHPRQPARLRRANRVQEDRTHHGRSQAFTAPTTSHPPIESIRRTQPNLPILGSYDFPQTVGRHKEIVAQTDGGMIPIVEPDASQKDKRKGKTLSWREAKICLAHAKGSQTPVYDGTIEGGVETAGRKLFACAVRAGFGATSHV